MNWLLYLLLMNEPTADTVKQGGYQDEAPMTINQNNNQATDEIQPDLELLLFLAEWDDVEKEEWVDPEIFAQDSQFNQQLDDNKAQSDEKDPDYH